jgi:hypothetical protein
MFSQGYERRCLNILTNEVEPFLARLREGVYYTFEKQALIELVAESIHEIRS